MTTENGMGWANSALPRAIVDRLGEPTSLDELADGLEVTDARVLWYLERLESAGFVVEAGGRWRRTERGGELLSRQPSQVDDVTVQPGHTVYDFVQAHADAAAGMFGETYVQLGGEHGGRLSHAQADEFQRRLRALIDEYFAPDKGDRSGTKYGLHWVFTPTDLHPLDDDPAL